MQTIVSIANSSHIKYAKTICKMMEEAAKKRGTGIAKRTPEYIIKKMNEGHAIIATHKDNVVGFCYIESWEGQKYVANSGLIIHQDYRKTGLARKIKKETFLLSKASFPNAKLFGITTSIAVMKINSDLGYKPATFSELPQDEKFWNGCKSCINHDILTRTERKMCLCTAMVCDLKDVKTNKTEQSKHNAWENFKRFLKLRALRLKRKHKLFQETP